MTAFNNQLMNCINLTALCTLQTTRIFKSAEVRLSTLFDLCSDSPALFLDCIHDRFRDVWYHFAIKKLFIHNKGDEGGLNVCEMFLGD